MENILNRACHTVSPLQVSAIIVIKWKISGILYLAEGPESLLYGHGLYGIQKYKIVIH